ncbi:MAG TPA: hypothetical protein PKD78_04025, partial [Saprospiraceae bacterium]|nr:hypothetical protein [Saprospiraceae bacterium]
MIFVEVHRGCAVRGESAKEAKIWPVPIGFEESRLPPPNLLPPGQPLNIFLEQGLSLQHGRLRSAVLDQESRQFLGQMSLSSVFDAPQRTIKAAKHGRKPTFSDRNGSGLSFYNKTKPSVAVVSASVSSETT